MRFWKDGQAFWAVPTVIALFFNTGTLAASAEPFADGIKLYGQKNYRGAADNFEAALKKRPTDVGILYYCAMAHQQANNRARARQLFEYISTNFSSTQQGQLSAAALRAYGSVSAAGGSSSGSGSSGSGVFQPRSGAQDPDHPRVDMTSMPNESRIPFRKGSGNHLYVNVQLNGHTIEMIFDTGAAGVVIGANHLNDLGIGRPQGRDQFGIGGVGDRTDARGWMQNMDLRLGPLYAKQFPVVVEDDMQVAPLLGQTFLSLFYTTIDDANQVIVFRKKSAEAARQVSRRTQTSVELPFTVGPGGHLIVNGEVNGKPCPMIFDTGASSVAFPMSACKRVGIVIPDNARESVHGGVTGETRAWEFSVDKLRVGPISRDDQPISVLENMQVDMPLLGQSFFSGMKYTIDNDKKVIRFD